MTVIETPKRFTEMTVQGRVEALASANSTGLNAATLRAMVRDVAYTETTLATRVYENFLGSRVASKGIPFQYCATTLGPISMVVETRIKAGMVLAYVKGDDGFTYADPSTDRFLFVASKLDISFNSIVGQPATRGNVRHGFVVAKVLELLRGGKQMGEADIAEASGILSKTVGRCLDDMQSKGFVEFDSVRADSYGAGETGYSIVKLVNREKLEFYIRNPDELKKEVLKRRAYFRQWGHITRTLQLRMEQLERTDLANKLKISSRSTSAVIPILSDLKIYEHVKFRHDAMSFAKINDVGIFVFDNIFGPILSVAREPKSGAVLHKFNKLHGQIDVHALFMDEMKRYVREKRNSDASKTDTLIYRAAVSLAEIGNYLFRAKDVLALLAANGNKTDRGTLVNSLRRLVRDDMLEKYPPSKETHITLYAVKR